MWLVLMFSAIVSIFGLTTGILGTAYCKQKSKAKICMAMGIVLIILIFIERILNIFYAFSLTESLSNIARYAGYADDLDTYAGISIVSGFIGLFVALVTPILYTIGASLFSKITATCTALLTTQINIRHIIMLTINIRHITMAIIRFQTTKTMQVAQIFAATFSNQFFSISVYR